MHSTIISSCTADKTGRRKFGSDVQPVNRGSVLQEVEVKMLNPCKKRNSLAANNYWGGGGGLQTHPGPLPIELGHLWDPSVNCPISCLSSYPAPLLCQGQHQGIRLALVPVIPCLAVALLQLAHFYSTPATTMLKAHCLFLARLGRLLRS
jgi:hypothetical protein